jgi:hypothetical protein
MDMLIIWVAAFGVALAVLTYRAARTRRAPEGQREVVAYYGGWDGYELPLRLSEIITKEEAEARGARGSAYIVGYFDGDGKLVRDVKIYRGGVFFEHLYRYHPSGRLKEVAVTNAWGEVTKREYDESERPTFVW